MQKKKVVMYQLPYPELHFDKQWGNTPNGAAMLKAMALQEGIDSHFDIDILPDALANHGGDAFLTDHITALQPDVLCATLYLWNAQRSIWLAKALKNRLPNLVFIVGGPEVSADSRYLLDHPAIDYGCIGEGEEIFVECLNAIAEDRLPRQLPGLFFRSKGTVCLCPGPGYVKDLKRLPSALRMEVLQLKAARMVSYETMRGCACACSYCTTGTLPPRFFQAEKVIADFQWLHAKGIKKIRLVGSNFLRHPDFFSICEALARINGDRSMVFYCFSYAEDVTPEKAAALKACNFIYTEIGMQTIHHRTLKRIRRPLVNPGRFLKGIACLREAGIDVSVDLIAGLPGETMEDVQKSISFLQQNDIQRYNVFPLQVLPGSPLRQQASELGISADSNPPYLVTATPTMSRAQISCCTKMESTGKKEDLLEFIEACRPPHFFRMPQDDPNAMETTGGNGPVTKLLVSGKNGMTGVSEVSARRLASTLIIIFSGFGRNGLGLNRIFRSIGHANPYCIMRPVFRVASALELEALLSYDLPDLPGKTIIAESGFAPEASGLAQDWTLFEQIAVSSPADITRIERTRNANVLLDLSLELNPVTLANVLSAAAASGKTIRFKNLALFYLNHLVLQQPKDRQATISTPEYSGTVAQLSDSGNLSPRVSMDPTTAVSLVHMQTAFLRMIPQRTH
ncbi:MAG: B12-binding domain-containing radical SAM protein [Desulfatitalea sp.]|nr:B12-binding domain-containing radical SAM protein [Desulfatitalea sp.]NNJ99278.1 B12-binding domain-containing radical SAM protein [Desulfatitalea sp.]